METIGASRSWEIDAEIAAMEKLRTHVNDVAFKYYFLTGTFLESSKRSGVTYVFRRLRPTVALTPRPLLSGRDGGMRILSTLCLHPIGLFEDSWAGAMCPTDYVIAHLLLMRSDEKFFWRKAIQHPAWAPESGL